MGQVALSLEIYDKIQPWLEKMKDKKKIFKVSVWETKLHDALVFSGINPSKKEMEEYTKVFLEKKIIGFAYPGANGVFRVSPDEFFPEPGIFSGVPNFPSYMKKEHIEKVCEYVSKRKGYHICQRCEVPVGGKGKNGKSSRGHTKEICDYYTTIRIMKL